MKEIEYSRITNGRVMNLCTSSSGSSTSISGAKWIRCG